MPFCFCLLVCLGLQSNASLQGFHAAVQRDAAGFPRRSPTRRCRVSTPQSNVSLQGFQASSLGLQSNASLQGFHASVQRVAAGFPAPQVPVAFVTDDEQCEVWLTGHGVVCLD
ncbi:hypothetical protein ACOMHN_039209 [Nucella lapillus]